MTDTQIDLQWDIRHELANLLRSDGYEQTQFLPFQSHHAEYLSNDLDNLASAELRLIERFDRRHPIMYEFSICPDYYAKKSLASTKLLLLRSLFLENNPTPLSKIQDELPEYSALIEHCCVEVSDIAIQSTWRVACIDDLMLFADPADSSEIDRVFFLRDSCLLGARLMDGEAPGSVADIGTGAGALALAACRAGADRVIAVDINQRALDFGSLNAAINGLEDRVEFRLGSVDALNPGEVRTIVTNPPYMMCGENTALCIDGGDQFGMQLPLQFIQLGLQRTNRIQMIVGVPIRDGINLLETNLPDDIVIQAKEVVDSQRLFDAFQSQRRLLESGVTHIDLTIYDFA